MPLPTIKGTGKPLLQHSINDFDPMRGWIYRYEYRGSNQAQMQLLQQDYARLGIASRLVFNQGDTATLEVEDATQQLLIDTWQIVGNEESRDVFSHPTMISLCTPTTIANLRGDLDGNPPKDPVQLQADLIKAGFTGPNAATVVRFYTLALRGSTEYRRAQYVLRHTTNAPNRFTGNISDVGVEQIYSTTKLLTEVTSGALWVYPLPVRLQNKISAIPTPSALSGYLWGWLKSPGTETAAANNRVDITTEYTLEQWSTDDYQIF